MIVFCDVKCAISVGWGHPRVHYFVATDSTPVLLEAQRIFGENKVLFYPIKQRSPDMVTHCVGVPFLSSMQAWDSSMIDMQILQSCTHFIGTANSSYTLAGSYLNLHVFLL